MTQELEMHEQEDGSFISDPAPHRGRFIGVLRGEAGTLLFVCDPNRALDAGDVITVGRPVLLRA